MQITKEVEWYINNQISRLYNNEYYDCWEYFDAIADKFGLDAEEDEINKWVRLANKMLKAEA